ncbi:MAG: hypothetical protein D6681_13715 [Calditrichaeota bacterium]|nr:MAG: hypothetical protein D6681_13715 [Calditrichota bacterium]
MLHRVKLPACETHLRWIVELQRALITALCDAHCHPGDVTIEWALNVVGPLGVDVAWLRRFCTWSKDKITFLARMQQIAGLDAETKGLILAAFDHDQKLEAAFADDAEQPHNLMGLSSLPAGSAPVVQAFFEMFYDPALYRGYRVPNASDFEPFSRQTFVDAFIEENGHDRNNNPVRVCAMCDGDLGNAEVDHYYPKGQYPFLSCHPQNLVPICSDCNSTANKGEKPPLSAGEPDENRGWFHPYLRPAAGLFDVEFQRDGSRLVPVLRSSDDLTQTRLVNHTRLFNLDKRWSDRLAHRVQATQRRIRKEKQRRRRALQRDELIEKLRSWAEDIEADLGIIPNVLIERAYFSQGADENPDVFEELMLFNEQG